MSTGSRKGLALDGIQTGFVGLWATALGGGDLQKVVMGDCRPTPGTDSDGQRNLVHRGNEESFRMAGAARGELSSSLSESADSQAAIRVLRLTTIR